MPLTMLVPQHYFSKKSESYPYFTLFSREKRVKSGAGYNLTFIFVPNCISKNCQISSKHHVRSVSWLNCLRRQFALYHCLLFTLVFLFYNCSVHALVCLFNFVYSLLIFVIDFVYILFFCVFFANLCTFLYVLYLFFYVYLLIWLLLFTYFTVASLCFYKI